MNHTPSEHLDSVGQKRRRPKGGPSLLLTTALEGR